MSLGNIELVIVGVAFILLYLYDKNTALKKGSGDNSILRHIFLIVGVSFFYMALILNYIPTQAVTVQQTISGTTTFTTNYIYNNTQFYVSPNYAKIDVSPTFVVYTVIYMLIAILIVLRMMIDVFDMFGDHT